MKTSSPIILTDPAAVSEQVWREREARAYLEFLEQLQPSPVAPYTNEDMDIFAQLLKRRGNLFVIYMQSAYPDYKTFFLSALDGARHAALARFT